MRKRGFPSASFLLALEREHNMPVTPYLPRSVARVRTASWNAVKNNSIRQKPPTFRSERRRK